MDKELKIIPPDGYEVDEEHSTLECIKFRPIKRQLPKSWKEFCEVYPIQEGEAYIGNNSEISQVSVEQSRIICRDRNMLPSKHYAEAMLALCQLIQLRDCYNHGWKQDFTNNTIKKYCITNINDNIVRLNFYSTNHILAFKSAELRDKFLKNFRDLLEVAKPLL